MPMAPQGVQTVADFRKYSIDELYQKLEECQSPGYYQMAVEELQRRFLDNVRDEVKHLHRSSVRIEWLTVILIVLTLVLSVSEIRKWSTERQFTAYPPLHFLTPSPH